MTKDAKDTTRKEMASAVNLFVHPVAGAAAMSAIGIGLASHAFGVWMGALTGAAGVSQRLFDPSASAEEPAKDGQAEAKPAGEDMAASGKPARAKAAAVAKQSAAPITVKPGSVDSATGTPLRNSKRSVMPLPVDDLKAIAGIGPKLEQVLNGLGIRSYVQIATWTGEEIAAIEEALGFKGRIARDDWTGQAAALAEARTKH
ncbi:MAG: NADH-ubiquinone dehydrogenase [Mesorhizobium sp.]